MTTPTPNPPRDGLELQPCESTCDLALSRRGFLAASAASVAAGSLPKPAAAETADGQTIQTHSVENGTDVDISVNGIRRIITVDPRVTLLDAVRNHLALTGTKKGCDHGQCGACTVLVNGTRVNSCLTLAVMHDGDAVTTIEGLGTPERLHPMQAAFIRHDGFQCGFCTPGQICSAVGMLGELKRGVPSEATTDLMKPQFSEAEVRERMAGNLCRCAAYPNIVAAICDAAGGSA